jgi:DNA-binding transcriptional LysR family regulator
MLGRSIRAGVALNTVRSAIDRLEHRFGEPLLVRTVEGVTPTDAGKQIAARAEDMARLVATIRSSGAGAQFRKTP